MLPHLFDVGVAVLDHEIPGVQLSLGLLQVLLNSHPSLVLFFICKERNICNNSIFIITDNELEHRSSNQPNILMVST